MQRLLDKKGPAVKVAAGLALALALTAAVSYAAVRPDLGHGPERHTPAAPPGWPKVPITTAGSALLGIPSHPPAMSTNSTARFRVAATGEPTLRCQLDRQPPQSCEAAVVYRGVGAGPHTFYVEAQRRGQAPVHASFGWTVLEPKPFTVVPRPATVGPLMPGAAPSPIPVVISNPNSIAITVTALRVTADGGPADCDPATNLALSAPDLGSGRLQIPAHGSVDLPSANVAAPTIGLRELDVNQDACQGANFDLSFSGSAGA